jgi:ATP synthase protein I
MFRRNSAGGLSAAAFGLETLRQNRHSDMTDDLEARRAELNKRLAAKRAETVAESKRDAGRDPTAMARAVKMSSEFIAGVLVGALLGWGIDYVAGTSPFGLIIFLFLGFGAGVLNVMRAAGTVAPPKIDREP